MKTKITGKYVVGFEEDDHVIYTDGEVVFEDDTIVFVGYDYPDPVDQVIECGHALVSPGFIDLNALGDIDTTALTYDSKPEVSGAKLWSEAYIQAGPRDVAGPEEEAFKSRYALTQLLRNGITTALPVTGLQYRAWAETYDEFENIIQIAIDLGLRTYLGPSYRSGVHMMNRNGETDLFWDEQKGLDGLADAIRFIEKFDGGHNGLIRGLLVPSTVETCTTELLKKTWEANEELQVPIRLHATQSMREFDLIKQWFGKTPVQYLEEIGFLGPRALIPHGIYVNGYSRADCGEGPDLDILRDSQTVIVHCPFPIARSGVALETFEKYKRHGIRMAMGTDCYPADMIMSMRLGTFMCRFAENSPFVCSTADIYRAATIGGADALMRDDLGKLAPGAKADIIVIDLDSFHMAQVDDPIRTVILNGFGRDVTTVFIDGNLVMQDRQIPGVDYSQLRTGAQEFYDQMKLGYAERDYRNRNIDELYPPGFKTIERRNQT